MVRRNLDITHLSPEQQAILLRFAAFPDDFSIDWFSDIEEVRISSLITVISYLEKNAWIVPDKRRNGFYRWTKLFPRERIIALVPEGVMPHYYRQAACILMKHLRDTGEGALKIAEVCILAGIEENDQDILLKAAVFEESQHRIASAIRIYDYLLGSLAALIAQRDAPPAAETFQTMITALERRVTLSLLHPHLKKIEPWLITARNAAAQIGDIRSQALLELLMGQNCWMGFRYNQAVQHFENAWSAIEKTGDGDLHRRGLQLRGLAFMIKGDLNKAVHSYEASLGELEEIADDDFSMITALHLSQCYTQLGMPQRALGISEAIYNQAKRNKNWPLVCFSLANSGLILIEMMHTKESRAYFEAALEICGRESTPMAEIISGVGLANIECIEGNYDKAKEHFKVLFRIPKSSWYHTLNACHIFEPGFILHSRGLSPVALDAVIDFLGELKEEHLNPLVYGTIRRLHLRYLDKETKPKEKIAELLTIEASLERIGALLELAKTRIDLARLYLRINQWSKAEEVAAKAWEFMKRTVRGAFPMDLKPLIHGTDDTEGDRLFDLTIAMGEALSSQKNTEHLLSAVITAISRL
ncbi:MAG: hypothetical protein N2Z74_05540, partial [Syntrophales bacterium]|nr:hypothetical protein [Syntrophales bacterium]